MFDLRFPYDNREGVAAPTVAAVATCSDAAPYRAGLADRVAVLAEVFDALAEVLADDARDREAAVLVPLIARIERRASALGVVVGGRAVAAQRREEGGDRIATEWLGQQTLGSKHDAEAGLSLVDGFVGHRSTRAAFESGELTRRQAELVLAATEADPGCEEEMLGLAQRAPVEDLARETRKRVREARLETPEERSKRHYRDRRLWMGTDEDGAFTGGFSTDTLRGATLHGGIELYTEALFRRDRRLGTRNKNSARRLDAMIVMTQVALGATPAELGFILTDLPAALRPGDGSTIGEPDGDGGAETVPGVDAAGVSEPVLRPDRRGFGDGDATRRAHSGPGSGSQPAGPTGSDGLDPPATSGGTGPGRGPAASSGRPPYRPRGPASPVINVHVDVGALRRGRIRPNERCEIEGVGPVSITDVRRLIGDAALRFILEEGRDVYNTAHGRRSMTAHQKTAVLAMYQECCVAGCGSRVGLQDDHQVPWAKTRHTWAPGMHPICPHHHARKTHHGWDFVPEAPDPVTGHLRLVPPEDPDHPDTSGAPPPMPPRQLNVP